VETPVGGEVELSNKGLDFTRAHHLVAGYDRSFWEDFRVKAEAYYQSLSQVPVEKDASSSFSMINVGTDFYIPNQDSLVNQCLVQNYGVELTLEKFLSDGYYFMLNGTLYESEYRANNEDWHNTAFDLDYILNALAGYEHWLSPRFALGADLRATQAGGKPYTPIDEEASIKRGALVAHEDKAYSERFGDYFRLDLRVYYRINYDEFYVEFAADFQNLTDEKNLYRKEFMGSTMNSTTRASSFSPASSCSSEGFAYTSFRSNFSFHSLRKTSSPSSCATISASM
jgi:hypothetical protein